jgi:type IV pilus assembly protein PilA
MPLRSRHAGFSLIELLIVVAIILIIAAISVPNLLRSRMAANEASAVGSLRTINTACIAYSTTFGGYPSSLSNLGTSGPVSSSSADLIDNLLAGGTKTGYTFVYSAGAPAGGVIPVYSVTASPLVPNQTGQRYFFTDESGVIRFNISAQASVSDAPLQ